MTAKGSTMAWGGWEPRACALCGEKITLQPEARDARFHMNDLTGTATSWHVECERHLGLPDLGRTR